MRFFRRFLFFIYSGENCVFVRPFRFLLMNASFKNGRTFRFADYKFPLVGFFFLKNPAYIHFFFELCKKVLYDYC